MIVITYRSLNVIQNLIHRHTVHFPLWLFQKFFNAIYTKFYKQHHSFFSYHLCRCTFSIFFIKNRRYFHSFNSFFLSTLNFYEVKRETKIFSSFFFFSSFSVFRIIIIEKVILPFDYYFFWYCMYNHWCWSSHYYFHYILLENMLYNFLSSEIILSLEFSTFFFLL